MLHRSSKEGLICITQPNHAWVSGQLAQAWGNEAFGQFVPRQEVCLGAQQHDIGWIRWEDAPTLNPQTGYPYKFTELPTGVHIGIWSGAKQLALPLGRYVTLLVSLHGTGLYERFRGWQNSVESTQIVREFLEREYAFQEQLTATLRLDSYYAAHTTPEVIGRNRKLVAVWDALSLLVCQGFAGERQVNQVPTADGETTLKLTNLAVNPHQITISPWPFGQSEVTLVYEGRLLRQTFTDETAMRETLQSDCWVTLSTVLKPE
jgi:hypothetical protein